MIFTPKQILRKTNYMIKCYYNDNYHLNAYVSWKDETFSVAYKNGKIIDTLHEVEFECPKYMFVLVLNYFISEVCAEFDYPEDCVFKYQNKNPALVITLEDAFTKEEKNKVDCMKEIFDDIQILGFRPYHYTIIKEQNLEEEFNHILVPYYGIEIL